jgi:hypothetical protein
LDAGTRLSEDDIEPGFFSEEITVKVRKDINPITEIVIISDIGSLRSII